MAEKRDLVYVWVNSNDGILSEVSVNLGSDYRFGIMKDGDQLRLTAVRNDAFILDLFRMDGSGLANMTVLLGMNGSGKTRLCKFMCSLTAGDYTAAEYVVVIAVTRYNGQISYEVFHQVVNHDLVNDYPLENMQRSSEFNLGVSKAVYYSPIVDYRDDNYYGGRPKCIDVSRNHRLYRIADERKESMADSYRGALMELMRSEDFKLEQEYLNDAVSKASALDRIVPHEKTDNYLIGVHRKWPSAQGLSPELFEMLADVHHYLTLWVGSVGAEEILGNMDTSQDKEVRKAILTTYYREIINGFVHSYGRNVSFLKGGTLRPVQLPEGGQHHPLDIVRWIVEKNPINQDISLLSNSIIEELSDMSASIKIAPFHELFLFGLDETRAFRLLALTNDLERAWNSSINEYRQERFHEPFLRFDRGWSLSSGEKFYLSLFSSLFHSAEWIQKELNSSKDPIPEDLPIYVVLDEADNGLHPSWQQGLVKNLITALPALFERKLKVRPHLHVIMASHSPIVLSDIPKEHVVVLNGADNKARTSDLDVQSFGANIHNLYRNSFFLTEHMLGNFAHDKIQEIIDDLNKEDVDAERARVVRKMIDQIGEPVIRAKLTRMYDDKFGDGLTDEERERFYEEELRKIRSRRKDEGN